MAMACFVERAPCLPLRMWSISSRTNSPACVLGALTCRASARARRIVFLSGIQFFLFSRARLGLEPTAILRATVALACADFRAGSLCAGIGPFFAFGFSRSAQLLFSLEPMVEITACRLAAFHENFMRTLGDLFVGGCVIWGCHFFGHGWCFFRLKLVTVILAFIPLCLHRVLQTKQHAVWRFDGPD